MKNLTILILLCGFIVSCASNRSHNAQASQASIKTKYGNPSLSPTAKKALKGELAQNEENKVTCKKVTKTGSRIPTVTCKTVAEHKSEQMRSKEVAERMIRDAQQNTGRFGDN